MRQVPLIVLLLLAPEARAAEAKIVLLSLEKCCPCEAWPEAEETTRQELLGYDFTVEVVDGNAISEKDRRIELFEIAKQHDATCALRIVRLTGEEGGGVDLWITDRITGKMVYRQIPIELAGDPEPASTVALRVVELLRASLMELQLPEMTPHTPPPEPVTKLVYVPRPPKPEGPVGLATGASILGSTGGTGVQGAVHWNAGYRFLPFLSVELEGLVSFASKEIQNEHHSTSFDVATVRSWLLWTIRPRGVVRPVLGAGAGIMFPWSKEVGHSGDLIKEYAIVAYFGTSAQCIFALSRSFWIRASVKVGAAAPPVKILFNTEPVATFGLPLIEGQLSLELRIP
jgi:hypothetical protein